jgi:hypothetical protein
MAHKFLLDVPEDKVFWLSNGQKLKSLKELRNALTSMPDDVFHHHVDQNHNDFANWIRDVVKDVSLANSIQKSTSLHDVLLKINSRIMDIEGAGHKMRPVEKTASKKKAAKKMTKKKTKSKIKKGRR